MIDTLPSLLITDDDRAWRETLGRAFEVRGFQALLAADGEEAFEIVQQRRIDLLLADMHMPRLTGLELLRRLQLFGWSPPAILVTANLTESLRKQALLANAVRVLSKPLALRQLIDVVDQVLRDRGIK